MYQEKRQNWRMDDTREVSRLVGEKCFLLELLGGVVLVWMFCWRAMDGGGIDVRKVAPFLVG